MRPREAVSLRPLLCAPIAAFAVACAPDVGADTADAPPVEDSGWYAEATLDPPFAHANAVWAGVALLDFDGDDRLDIFFTNGLNTPDALYRNLGDGRFEDVAAAAGVDSLTSDGAVVAGDLDDDGDADLVVSGACTAGSFGDGGTALTDGHKTIYRNQGDGTFTAEILPQSVDGAPTRACTVSTLLVDIDVDGDLDLAVMNGGDPDLETPWQFRKNRQPGVENYVLLNDGTGSFAHPLTWTSEPSTFAKITFTAASFDVDGDGRPDLLEGEAGFPMEVWLQSDTGPALQPGYTTGDGLWMGLAVADYDGDGDFDVYGTNQGLSPLIAGYDTYAQLDELHVGEWINVSQSLLLNDGGVFAPADDWPVDAPQVLAGDLFEGVDGAELDRVGPTDLARYAWGWGAVALDADLDGWMDVAFNGNNCSMPMCVVWTEERGAGPGALLRNVDGAGFEDVTAAAGIANVDARGRYQDGRGLATGDLNGDGVPDLVFANRTYNPTLSDPEAQVEGVPHVWISRRPPAHHWLRVDARGTTDNRDGVGAVVRVDLGDRVVSAVVGAGGSTNSSSERVLTLGTGDAEVVDVEVTFPSGAVVERTDVATDATLVVEEG